jgi:hydrogenase-4 component E
MEAAPVILHLDALAGGVFLLASLGIVAMRQILACLQFFVLQSLLLTASALLLGVALRSPHLVAVAGITIVSKTLLIPWLLRRTVSDEVYGTREIVQVLNIPTTLLIAAALIFLAYAIIGPVTEAAGDAFTRINLPIGLAALFLGAFTVTVRREAVPQLLGLIALENGVFFAGIAIVPDLPLIAELAAAVDVVIVALVVGLLMRRIQKRIGTTSVGRLAVLREE